MIDDNHAVLFGGWDQKRRMKTNDVYIVDLDRMVSYQYNKHDIFLGGEVDRGWGGHHVHVLLLYTHTRDKL